jgi:hypothetical protein
MAAGGFVGGMTPSGSVGRGMGGRVQIVLHHDIGAAIRAHNESTAGQKHLVKLIESNRVEIGI